MAKTLNSLPAELLIMSFDYVVDYSAPEKPRYPPQLTESSMKDVLAIRRVDRRLKGAAQKLFARVLQKKPFRLMHVELYYLQCFLRDDTIAANMTSLFISEVLPVPNVFPTGDPRHGHLWRGPMAEYTNHSDDLQVFLRYMSNALLLIIQRLDNLEVVAIKKTPESIVDVPDAIRDEFEYYLDWQVRIGSESGSRRDWRDRVIISNLLRAMSMSSNQPVYMEIPRYLLEPEGLRYYRNINPIPAVRELRICFDSGERSDHDSDGEEEPSDLADSYMYDSHGRMLRGIYAVFPNLTTLHMDLLLFPGASLHSFANQLDPRTALIPPFLHRLTTLHLRVRDEPDNQPDVVNMIRQYRRTLRHLGLRLLTGFHWDFRRNLTAFSHFLALDTLYVEAYVPAGADNPKRFMATEVPRFATRAIFRGTDGDHGPWDGVSERPQFEIWFGDQDVERTKKIWSPPRFDD